MNNGMLNTTLNGLQMYRTKYSSDLLDENAISQSLLTERHEASNTLSYLFGIEDHSVLDYLTGGTGRTMTIENREYQWKVMIEQERPITIEKAEDFGGTVSESSTSGLGGTPIYIWTAEKRFDAGALIEFDDNNFQARVMGEPVSDGHYYRSTLMTMNNDSSYYIPGQYLLPGSQLSIVGSAYEEGSKEADIIDYEFPVTLKNQLTIMRKKYEITGSAYASVMVIAMRDPKTKKTTKYWAPWQEWLALRKWYKNMDYQLVYGQYSDGSVKGSTGRPVYTGAGLLQQISPSTRRSYTKLTTSLLQDFLFDISYNTRGLGNRNYVALTGEMGMKEFDRVLREQAATYNLIDTKFVSGSGQNLTLGGQFTTYKMLNGITLTLKHFPAYDDTYHHRKLHPVTGKPLESYRMTFLDFGMYDGEPNIVKVVRKGREMVMWTVGGALTSNGFVNNKNQVMSNSYDGYVVNMMAEVGIMVKNPSSCGELYMNAA